jgi:hypothetical protein
MNFGGEGRRISKTIEGRETYTVCDGLVSTQRFFEWNSTSNGLRRDKRTVCVCICTDACLRRKDGGFGWWCMHAFGALHIGARLKPLRAGRGEHAQHARARGSVQGRVQQGAKGGEPCSLGPLGAPAGPRSTIRAPSGGLPAAAARRHGPVSRWPARPGGGGPRRAGSRARSEGCRPAPPPGCCGQSGDGTRLAPGRRAAGRRTAGGWGGGGGRSGGGPGAGIGWRSRRGLRGPIGAWVVQVVPRWWV